MVSEIRLSSDGDGVSVVHDLLANYNILIGDDLDFIHQQLARTHTSFGWGNFKNPYPYVVVNSYDLNGIALNYARQHGSFELQYSSGTHYTLFLQLEGQFKIECGGDTYVCGPSTITLTSPGPKTMTCHTGRRVSLNIEPHFMDRIMDEQNDESIRRPDGVQTISTRSELGRRLYLLMMYAIELIDNEGSAIHCNGLLRESIKAQIIELIAETFWPKFFRKSSGNDYPPNSVRVVNLAKDLIERQLTQPTSISQIASELRITRRMLERIFRSEQGCSPLQYIHGRKLTEARKLLSNQSAYDTVGEVAAQVGFYHFGRFAKAYQNKFGEPPRETLSRYS